MTMYISKLFTIIVLSVAVKAHADWAVNEGAYGCNEKRGFFSVALVIKTSSPEYDENPHGVPQKLQDGENTTSCNLSGKVITLDALQTPPSARGMCMGAGTVTINSLSIGDQTIVSNEKLGSWCVDDGERLIRADIKVTNQAESKFEMTLCYAEAWSWWPGYTGLECSTNTLDANRVRRSF
jgi:hypothetical protein